MKRKNKTFEIKLWQYFICFAAIIFVILWLLQTVFLQNFYDRMVIHNVKKVAVQISWEKEQADFEEQIDRLASENSLLIFLTDWNGSVLYCADEHKSVYGTHSIWQESQTTETKDAGNETGNPYRKNEEPMNWELGVFRNLPQNYSEFLKKLSDSTTGVVSYATDHDDAYIYGMALASEKQNEEMVLYISTQLGAVGSTVSILRIQLIWVTLAALVLGFILAYFLSRQFARPIDAITAQAKGMISGGISQEYEKGFCRELDELSDTLKETAVSLGQLENARKELLANVSHDLRTPLTMIKGYAEMIRDISWENEQEKEEDLKTIIRETDRLTELVNDILEYSSVQDMPETKLQEINLYDMIQLVSEQFAPLCKQKEWELNIVGRSEQWVMGNEEQLKRIFYNLIDNAICHSGDGHTIEILVEDVGDVVKVEIKNDGEGIPEEELPYIWDRYFTARQRRSDGSRSGLGLAITKELLMKQKAKYGVENREGGGCSFWFELDKCRHK